MYFKPLDSLLAKINIYDMMIVILLIVAASAIVQFGYTQTIPRIAISVIVASILDLVIKYYKYKKWMLPKTAIISGLFIGMLLAFDQPFYIFALAAVVAIASKHVINVMNRHVFNPTLFSMLVVSVVFNSYVSWWAAYSFPVIVILGLLINYKFGRLDLSLPFIATYLLLTNAFAFLTNTPINSITVQLKNTLLLFYAFFMLIEPRTSPSTSKARLVYAPIAAIIIFATSFFYPQNNFVLGALLANLAVLAISWKIK